MTRQEIFEKLSEVFSDVFDEEITVTAETTAADIEEWDSLTHITLISEVEDAFAQRLGLMRYFDENAARNTDIHLN